MADHEIGNLRTRLSWEDDGANRSLEGFKRDLRGLRSEMNLAKSGGKEYTNSLKGMRDQSDVLTRRFKTQKEQARELRRRYDELVAAGKGNTTQAKNLQSQYNNTTAQMNRTEQQLKSLNAEIKRQESPWTILGDRIETAGTKMQTVGRGMTTTGRQLTTKVTAPILGLAAGALKVGMDFEEGMSKVQAISGATGDDMEQLEAQAREMGAETRFSATEAADGMSYLAMAGFDTQEIMETMPGLLDLAASANMDLGQAADIASNIISGFGMEAKEAGRVSDVLAASAANANTSVDQMGDAMSYVAPVAAGAGLSLEETAGAIGVLSDSGIQGQRAGTALREVISSLQNPTGDTAKVIEEMGISMEDVDPAANSLSEILEVLEDAGMDSSEAMRLVGQDAGPGLIALLEQGSGGLSDFTKDMEDSEGAAAEMAETMEDNAKGSLREFKSALEEAGLSLSEHMLPAVTDLIEGGTDLARKFGELDEETQKNIIKFGGLAAAAGPAALVLGNATTAAGGMLRVGGKLSKSLGKAGGAGLIGSIGRLGPLAVGGVAVAGIAAIAGGLYKLHERSKETEEANFDLAESLSDQAVELDNSADTFDKLSEKAKISNEELAELNDLNIKITESNNPGEIKELQEQYDELAKNSGLSKDELQELFEANSDIIEQSPDVETSISEQGNKFVENTEAVKEYVAELYEMSRQELSDEMLIAEKERTRLIKENKETKKEIASLDKLSRELRDLEAMSEEDRNAKLLDWHTEIKKQMALNKDDQEKFNELKEEEEIMLGYINDGLGQGLSVIRDQRDELNEKVNKNDEELEKLDALNGTYADILLKQAGINEEGDKGLANLDKSINKHQEEIEKLRQQKEEKGELSEKDQERLNKLTKTLEKEEDTRNEIFKQTGLYNDLNNLADGQLERLDEEEQKRIKNLLKTNEIKVEEGNILQQLKNKNTEYDEQISKLEESRKKEGANKDEINNQIKSLENKKKMNDEIKRQILEAIGLNQDQIDKIIDGTTETKNQGSEIDENNDKTRTGIRLEEDRTAEAGKSVDKEIDVWPFPTIPELNRGLREGVDKDVTILPSTTPKDLRDSLAESVDKDINLNAKPSGNNFTLPLLQYAQGTKGHPTDSPAVVGDGKGSNAGSELITEPNGKQYLSPSKPTVVGMKKGTHVTPAKTTKKMLANIPHYADGVGTLAKFSFKKLGALGLGNHLLGGSMGNPFAPVAKSAISKMTSMFLSGNLGLNLVGGTSSKSASAWANDIRRAAATMGESVTNAQVQGIISQINRESNGNPGIVQSSSVVDINTLSGNPARGLLQYIPQTFSAYKVPGHGNIYSGYDQLLAFFNNKNWRRDLPYGTRGWGPTGGRKYATGTDNHPGGPFLAGEKGWELGRLGDHWEVLNKGVYDRPRGYEVYPHDESKKIMRAIHNVPAYADGTGGRSGVMPHNGNRTKEISLLKQQVNLLTDIVTSNRGIENKPVLSEGDIQRSYNKMDSRQSTKHAIFAGKVGGVT